MRDICPWQHHARHPRPLLSSPPGRARIRFSVASSITHHDAHVVIASTSATPRPPCPRTTRLPPPGARYVPLRRRPLRAGVAPKDQGPGRRTPTRSDGVARLPTRRERGDANGWSCGFGGAWWKHDGSMMEGERRVLYRCIKGSCRVDG